MKQANLISVLNASNSLTKELFDDYLNYHSIKIKISELRDLQKLVDNFKSTTTNMSLFDKYFIGYSIPQIGKEFDLLRIDDDLVINIEIKRQSTEEKIKAQLIRNRYYLGFLKKEVQCYTYISSEDKLYTLDNSNNLEEVRFKMLVSAIASQKLKSIYDIDNFFNPSNYLISPFNSTNEFIKRKYFLTSQQEDIKNNILKSLAQPSYSIISIKGKAGTGKTLLTYDIALDVSDRKETLIIHCGHLNDGHYQLKNDYGWEIIPAKDIISQNFSKYHLIIVDEAQRIYPNQLDLLIKETKKLSNNLILSYDGQQTLRKWEINNNVEAVIENENTIPAFELTTKIRTNKEVASFIQCLFSKKRNLEKHRYSNIELNYFDDYQQAKHFLQHLRTEKWKTINYTPSNRTTLPYEKHNLIDEFDNAHRVIGQEFDNVVAVIDEHFYYKSGYLSTRNYKDTPYYHPSKMLWQIVSRTRIKLSIVIIKNEEVLERCLEILNQK